MTRLTILVDDAGCASPQVAGCRESLRDAASAVGAHRVDVCAWGDPWPTDGWVLMIEAADRVVPDGLAALLAVVEATPAAGVVFGDHVRTVGELGERSHHPIWSYEYLLSAGHVEGAVAVRADLLTTVAPEGPRGDLRDGASLEMLLRAAEAGVEPVRCPEVVVERHGDRLGPERHRALVAAHLARLGVAADIGITDQRTLHVRRADPGSGRTVSVVIPAYLDVGRRGRRIDRVDLVVDRPRVRRRRRRLDSCVGERSTRAGEWWTADRGSVDRAVQLLGQGQPRCRSGTR